MKRPSVLFKVVLGLFLTLSYASSAQAEQLVGVTQIGSFSFLVGVDTIRPLVPTFFRRVKGLQTGQKIVGLDLRPATNTVYGVATTDLPNGTSNLYAIDVATGVATVVGTAPFPDLVKSEDEPTSFGFDFNPTIDRVRVVSTMGQNAVFNPGTGALTLATDLFYGTGDVNAGKIPEVAQIAYDNNFAGATVTQQRAIDSRLDVLATLANNAGTLGTIGRLGTNVTSTGGFDVSASGVGWAILTTARVPLQQLYTIDLQTGAANPLGLVALGLLDLNGMTALTQAN